MAGALQTNSADAKQLVFVIDDDADVREGLEALLQSVSLPCEVFSSTREFLNRKPSHTVSCLVLDVRLPGPSGLDFQTELAKAQIDIRIIFITGHGDTPMTVRAMKAGAVEFLTKPVRDQDLLDAISVALERDRQQREKNKSLAIIRSCFETLTPREQQVFELVSAGLMNKQIAG